jgi:hypothetical protein
MDGEGRGRGQGRGKAKEESCLILDEKVDQVVKAAHRHYYVVGIIDRGVTRLQ